MRILVTSDHIYPTYPSIKDTGADAIRKYKSSFSSRFIQDLIVKGLTELGHEVFYWLPEGKHQNLSEDIEIVHSLPSNLDIAHLLCCNILDSPIRHLDLIKKNNIPWMSSWHLAEAGDFKIHEPHLDRLIFVSEYAAKTFGKSRYVHNGFDPSEYIFQKEKEDYYLFLCAMNKAEEKGLSIALNLAQKMGFSLIVAGNAPSEEVSQKITKQCEKANAVYVGGVYGLKKAKLFAGAKAFLFPTQLQESFGGVAVEAMMSGTPIIASNNGALPEIMSPEVGFVCANMKEYEQAVENIDTINPSTCRAYSIQHFHYLNMAKNYAKMYQEETIKANVPSADFISSL